MTNLDRNRFTVGAICLSGRSGSVLERMLDEHRVHVFYLGKNAGFDPRTFLRVYRAIRDFKPDLVHSHVHVLRYALPALLAIGPRAKIHTVHNVAEGEVEPRARWIQRLAFSHGIVPVSVAREVAASLERMYGISDGLVVGNGIPVAAYRTTRRSRSEWRRQEGLRDDDVLLTCVAHFRPQKNHLLLIEAFADASSHCAKAHLILTGHGEMEPAARAKVRDLGLSSCVHFIGLRNDVSDVLAASDMFVLASDFEGSPLAVMEAMAAGLPIVTTGVGGVPEILDSGVEGIVVPAGSAEALAGAMCELLMDLSLRRRMGSAGAKRASEFLDLTIMAGKYSDIYGKLLTQTSH
jgi:glycosyltransferase involved in cell wall biosynthesis